MKKTLAIIFGGCSSEYEVSLHSAAAVINAVDESVYEVVCIGITRQGQWLLYSGTAQDIENDTWWQNSSCVPAVLSPSREDSGLWAMHSDGCTLKRLDVVFPVLHGSFGEDGTVQGLLELSGIPFVGCGCAASAMCMDKDIAHSLAEKAGVACPRSLTVYGSGQSAKTLASGVIAEMKDVPFPWFVKPAREGSSFGISHVANAEELAAALDTALRYDEKIVIEEEIDGFEVGCAIMGGNEPVTGVVDAISLKNGFFDFHEKYTLETAKILLPAPIEDKTAEEIKNTAIKLYKLFGCKGFARVDLFLNSRGEIIFNEINTIPGLTPHSRYPGMFKAAGTEFSKMIEMLLKEAEK